MAPDPFPDKDDPIGIVGLGLVGMALAHRLLAAGRSVLGHDISPERLALLASRGCPVAPRVQDLFLSCRTILLSLPSDTEVRTVLDEAQPALRPGQCIVNTTTGDPRESERIAAALARQDVTFVDAPVSGSSEQITLGDAVFLMGAEPDAFHRLLPLLQSVAREVIHAGPAGTGSRMKLVTNLVLGLNRAALAEGLVLGKALGLAPHDTARALATSAAYSRIMDAKIPRMLRREFPPAARLAQHLKDVHLMLDAAQDCGTTLPFTETHRDLLKRAVDLGLGDLDNSAILLAIESVSTGCHPATAHPQFRDGPPLPGTS